MVPRVRSLSCWFSARRAISLARRAFSAPAPRQGHVQGLGAQLAFHVRLRHGVAARLQGGLDLLLDAVDLGAAGFLFLDGQGGQALEQLGHATGLAQVAGLGVLKLRRRGGVGEITLCLLHQIRKILHKPSLGR